jgi:hypothetical protein
MQYIGPMALSLGIGAALATKDFSRYRRILFGYFVGAALQVLLDGYNLFTAQISARFVVDVVVLGVSAVCVVPTVLLDVWPQVASGSDIQTGSSSKRFRSASLLLVFYLVLGGTCAITLPVLMNRVLDFPLSGACVPWVQTTGTYALGLAVAFTSGNLISKAEPIYGAFFMLAVSACVVELALDAEVLAAGSFKFWPVLADIFIVLTYLIALRSEMLAQRKAIATRST